MNITQKSKNWIKRKRNKLKYKIVVFRLWLLKALFNTEEKRLIIHAIDDRISILQRLAVSDKWVDKYDVLVDCENLSKLRKIFSTDDYR